MQTENLTITILTENVAGGKFLAEHGLSYLIEIDEEQILFDTGHSDVFLQNAGKLKIDIGNDVNKVVLSHGHWDHGDGLIHLSNKQLFTHPASFSKRFRKADHTPVGLKISRKQALQNFDLTESSTSLKLSNNLYFLGEIPRKNNFESFTTDFMLADGTDDFIIDDTALAAIVNNQLVVITGCSHSGICNICEYAKIVTGIKEIRAVIGGFHLKKQDGQTQNTIKYFQKNKVGILLPSHCTALPALALFYQTFTITQVKTGMTFRF
ncbi:MBL fold metallo-hydrolase [uncultured Draconibacterium sp.]|uniref:MBL fold metallo-hydrolase n=1 Tax=uncultured Draconibacterium sp. TaxID=1573823 RepID=UPI0032612C94